MELIQQMEYLEKSSTYRHYKWIGENNNGTYYLSFQDSAYSKMNLVKNTQE